MEHLLNNNLSLGILAREPMQEQWLRFVCINKNNIHNRKKQANALIKVLNANTVRQRWEISRPVRRNNPSKSSSSSPSSSTTPQPSTPTHHVYQIQHPWVESVSIESSENTQVTHYRLIGNKTIVKEARKRKLHGWISCALWGSAPDDLCHQCMVIELPMMSVRTPGDIGQSVQSQNRWSMADALSVYLTVIGYIRLFQEQLLLMPSQKCQLAMRHRVLRKQVWMIIMSFYSHLFLFEAMETDYGYELDSNQIDGSGGHKNNNHNNPRRKPTVTFSQLPAPSTYVPRHRMKSPFAEYRFICGSVIPWNSGIHRVPLTCVQPRNDVIGVVCNVANGSVSPLHWSAAHWSTASIYGLTRDGMMIQNNIIMEEDLNGWGIGEEVSVSIDCDYGRISFFVGKKRTGKTHTVIQGGTYFLMVGSQENDSIYQYQAEVF